MVFRVFLEGSWVGLGPQVATIGRPLPEARVRMILSSLCVEFVLTARSPNGKTIQLLSTKP